MATVGHADFHWSDERTADPRTAIHDDVVENLGAGGQQL
jgi:hypothetical protein